MRNSTLFPARMTGLLAPALQCLIRGSQYDITCKCNNYLQKIVSIDMLFSANAQLYADRAYKANNRASCSAHVFIIIMYATLGTQGQWG